ncbi:MAG: proprotein convertase P-domain-containing protein [Planctomycetota bacterium]
MRFLSLLVLSSLISVSVANADISQTGPGATINDLSTASSSIFVTTPEIVSDVFIDINGFNHTFIGNLQVTLTHVETGSSATLFDGVGAVGNVGLGDGSDLGDSYNFGNGFPFDLWSAAAAAGDADVIPGGPYFATDLNGAAVDIGAMFAGENTVGEWRLDVFDRANGDTGSFNDWGIRIISSPVPEPSSLFAMLAIGCAALSRRKRQIKPR